MGKLVAVLCEFSGTVRDAFVKQGHNAISVDLLPSETSGNHYQGDVVSFLDKYPDNYFDLIIAHPPCTALAVSGNAWYGKGMPKHDERIQAAQWTQELWDLCKRKSHRVCLENPVGVLRQFTDLPKPSYVQPYQFGHKEQKKTGLYLHNLEPLVPTDDVYEAMMQLPVKERQRLHYLPPSADRWKIRSKTYQGIADAMSKQWLN